MPLIAYVAGVERGSGRGNLGVRESVWDAQGRKERNACKDAIVFSIFLPSDSERKNSDWSELIKCQCST